MLTWVIYMLNSSLKFLTNLSAKQIRYLIQAAIIGFLLAILVVQSQQQLEFIWRYRPALALHKAKILLVWFGGYGETDTIARLKIAATHENIDLRIINGNPHKIKREPFNEPVEKAIKLFRPDFLLLIEDRLGNYPGIRNYMTLTHGTARYLRVRPNGKVDLLIPHLANFDALLPSFKDIDLLQQAMQNIGKTYNGFEWYPTVYITEYAPANPQKLYYSGGKLWDKTRGSVKYREVYKKLDSAGYFAVSGPEDTWQDMPNSWIGLIPFDGKSLLAKIHDAGMELVLHHAEHLRGGAPTARIFEAAAANVVIISDKHPFVMQNFGDNVLYIDVSQDADSIFNQIDRHVKWILAHPIEAKQKAANCNAIFKQKYSLEQQLQKLLALHQRMQA